MNLHIYPVVDILISPNRQRKIFTPESIQELAASIADCGVIHPIVVRKNPEGLIELVAGERRIKALDICWGFGQEVRCGNRVIPEGSVPCTYLGSIDPILAFEIELEENIRRVDLDWKEKASATRQLYELRRMQAERKGAPIPTPATIAIEVSGTSEGWYQENIRQDLILSQHLANPVVAAAKTRKEAFKALKRDEENKRHAELGRSVGATFTAAVHTLLQGDCLKIMQELPDATFDVILTDPPYGIDAQDFGDSDGKAQAHFYDDSYETWRSLVEGLAGQTVRLSKPEAHLYCFCDIDRFIELRDILGAAGWTCFRTPLIAVNPTAMRTPWVDGGPQRKWQMCLYARKGNKPVMRIYGDVLTYPSDANLGHQAQKPVGLYQDLLRRSVRPGDTVLDPFCGTGTIFPAAHELKVRATGIELDAAAAGIAAARLGALK
jgi:DNA modification methylase